jgi:6-phosphofructo-2-kinase
MWKLISPTSHGLRKDPAGSTPRIRPTTLNIPGLTRSKASPDGRIPDRDVGSKLIIVMVGLPARGKSYITKKIARYLNWQQHDARIFNVGERRRLAAGGPTRLGEPHSGSSTGLATSKGTPAPGELHPSMHLNGLSLEPVDQMDMLPEAALAPPPNEPGHDAPVVRLPAPDPIEHNADFFDPDNIQGSRIREKVALETLDELLDYILNGNGSVGILDATNSTLARRKAVVSRIRERAPPELNVLFIESQCVDAQVGSVIAPRRNPLFLLIRSSSSKPT